MAVPSIFQFYRWAIVRVKKTLMVKHSRRPYSRICLGPMTVTLMVKFAIQRWSNLTIIRLMVKFDRQSSDGQICIMRFLMMVKFDHHGLMVKMQLLMMVKFDHHGCKFE